MKERDCLISTAARAVPSIAHPYCGCNSQ